MVSKDFVLDHLKRIIYLVVGCTICTVGVALIIQANVGVQPWDVFHQGLSKVTGLSFGQVSIIVGYSVLFLSAFAKIFPGPGTIFNIMYMGFAIDIALEIIPQSPSLMVGIAMNIAGSIVLALGACMYLRAMYGAGARDSLVMGLVHKYKIDTKFVKPAVEGIIVIVGIILGGNFGIGTFISLLIVGYFIDVFFGIINFNPKESRQMTFLDFFIKDRGILENENSRN